MFNKLITFFLSLVIAIGFAVDVKAQNQTYWYLDGTSPNAVLPMDGTWHVGLTGSRIAKLWVQDLDIAGTLVFGGSMGSSLDMDGYDITMDTDGDSAFTNDRDAGVGDDEIGVTLNSLLAYIFKEATLDLGTATVNAPDIVFQDGDETGDDKATLALSHDGAGDYSITTDDGHITLAANDDIYFDPEGLDIIIGDGGNEDYLMSWVGDTSTGTLNYDEDNADFEFDQDVTSTGTVTGGTLTDGTATITSGAISASSIDLTSSTVVSSTLDEDDMASNSATALITQQSSKAFSDGKSDDAQMHGFTDNTETTIGFNDGNYTYTLTDAGAGWSYYRDGIKYTVSGNKTTVLSGSPPSADVYYVYIDATDGTLSNGTTVWTLADSKVPVASINWDNALTPKYVLSDERHTTGMNKTQHSYEHLTYGTRLQSSGAITGYTLGSDVDANKQFDAAQSKIWDEDLQVTTAAITGGSDDYHIAYRTGASTWVWLEQSMPFIFTGAGYINYDNAGTMTQGQNNKYYTTYLIATNSSGLARYTTIHGQAEYSTLVGAEAEQFFDLDLTGLDIAEGVATWKFIWDSSAAYTSSGKCELEVDPIKVDTSISTAGAPSGLGTMSTQDADDVNISGGVITGLDNLALVNGGALQTGTTAADTALLQAYDNDTGPGYITFGTLTAGNTPTFELTSSVTANGETLTTAATSDTFTNKTLDCNGTGNSCSNIDVSADVTGVLPVANGGTNASTASITSFNNITGYTASGATGTTSTNIVFSTSPTFITPALGTPASGVLTNATGYPGDASLVTTGALNSGSITSGFGTIDTGADAITGGAVNIGLNGTISGIATWIASDNDQVAATINTSDNLAFSGATGEYTFDNNIGATGTIYTNDAAGSALLNEAATATNPTVVANRAENDTGLGWVSDEVHVVLGGADEYSFEVGTADFTGNSIVNVGSVGLTGARVTKLWATDIESSNDITVGGTALASIYSPIAGSGSIVTVGALNAGSITSGFTSIDVGAGAITTTGDVTGGGIHVTGDTASGDAAALGYTATEGLIMTGQGSSNDLTWKNDADGTFMHLLTGTTELVFDAFPITPTAAPDADYEVANKKYVDDNAGTGDVTKVGTPVNNQIGIWTGDGTLEGDVDVTYDGTDMLIGATAATTKIQFRDAAVFINSADDGHLDIDADVSVDVNSAFNVTGIIGAGDNIQIADGDKVVNASRASTFIDFDQDLTLAADTNINFNSPLVAEDAAGPAILDEAATTTNPTLVPNQAETDTGIGWASDVLHFVGGGSTMGNISITALTAVGDVVVGDDILLASAAVQNWDSGDVTLTHSAAKLTWGGDGAVEIDFNNHELTNMDIDSGDLNAAVTVGGGGVVVGISNTQTLTNKRITARVATFASDATPDVNADNYDAVTITAQAAAITDVNMSGTPTNFQKLIFRILDNGTGRAITWGADFEDTGVALPTTTTANKVLTVGFIYDTVSSKWGCVAVANET